MKKTIKKSAPKTNALVSAFQTKDTTTLNGAVSHSTTGTSLLDFFSRGGALRNHTESDITALFAAAYKEDKSLALKTLFYLGDVRGGQGERRLFRTGFNWLAKNDTMVAQKLVTQVPEFTRFDNILESSENTPLEAFALKFVAKQIKADSKAETPTLAAKWTPSEQASSDTTRRLASKVRNELGFSSKVYRQTLSGLRKKIGIVESLMAQDNWSEINFQSVPSRAALIYKGAFKKHQPERYSSFLSKVEKGEAKINASTLYPYDLMRGVLSKSADDLRTIEAQWKTLPDYTDGKEGSVLVVADVSGSMGSLGHNSGSNVSPIDVCMSLTVYTAERNKGPFNGYFLTFSDNSRLNKLVGGNLQEKLRNLHSADWGMSTNLQSAFNAILAHGLAHNVPQKEMPAKVIIISDMQFNQCVGGDTNHEGIKKQYENAGYKLPEIVFWQVNAYGDSPVKFDEKGTMLCSGASPSILKTILSGKITSPWDMFLKTVDSERYKSIKA